MDKNVTQKKKCNLETEIRKKMYNGKKSNMNRKFNLEIN